MSNYSDLKTVERILDELVNKIRRYAYIVDTCGDIDKGKTDIKECIIIYVPTGWFHLSEEGLVIFDEQQIDLYDLFYKDQSPENPFHFTDEMLRELKDTKIHTLEASSDCFGLWKFAYNSEDRYFDLMMSILEKKGYTVGKDYELYFEGKVVTVKCEPYVYHIAGVPFKWPNERKVEDLEAVLEKFN